MKRLPIKSRYAVRAKHSMSLSKVLEIADILLVWMDITTSWGLLEEGNGCPFFRFDFSLTTESLPRPRDRPAYRNLHYRITGFCQ